MLADVTRVVTIKHQAQGGGQDKELDLADGRDLTLRQLEEVVAVQRVGSRFKELWRAGVPFRFEDITETGNFTLGPQHYGRRVLVDSASEVVCTLPSAGKIGEAARVLQVGDGRVRFEAGTGATYTPTDAGLIRTRKRRSAALPEVQANGDGSSAVWIVNGDLAA